MTFHYPLDDKWFQMIKVKTSLKPKFYFFSLLEDLLTFFISSKSMCLFYAVFDKKLVVDVTEEEFLFSSSFTPVPFLLRRKTLQTSEN